MQFANQMQHLTFVAQEAQDTLSAVQQFAAAGGAFRLALVVDHPDPAIRQIVEQLAAEHLPREVIMNNLVKCAEREVAKSNQAMVDLSFSFSVQADAAAVPRPTVVGAAA